MPHSVCRLPLAAALAGALLVFSTVPMAFAAEALNGYSQQKVVYHVNDIESANAALRNITNHLDAVGDENIDLVVVTHSSGINFLLDGASDSGGNTFDMAVPRLAERGVRFELCRNTLTARNIDEGAFSFLAEHIDVVPSGVATVAQHQLEGYVLLKP